MILYLDLLNGTEVGSDSYEGKLEAKGGVLVCKSAQMQVDGEVKVNTGANASAEGGEEELDASEVKTVVNIVHNHSLVRYPINDAKEFKTLMKGMWKKVIKKLQLRRLESVDLEGEELPTDAKEKEAAIVEAADELADDADIKVYQDITARLTTFQKRLKAVEKFIKKKVTDNFSSCDFYHCGGGEYGSAVIVPAVWEGSDAAPTFYFLMDALDEEKA